MLGGLDDSGKRRCSMKPLVQCPYCRSDDLARYEYLPDDGESTPIVTYYCVTCESRYYLSRDAWQRIDPSSVDALACAMESAGAA